MTLDAVWDDLLALDEDCEWAYLKPLPDETPDEAAERCRRMAATEYHLTMVGPIHCSDEPRRYALDPADDPNPDGSMRPVPWIEERGRAPKPGSEVRLWVLDLTELEAA